MGKNALLDVVDAAWRVGSDRQSWMDALVGAGGTALPAEVSAAAYHFNVSGGKVEITHWGGERDLSVIPGRLYAEVDPAMILMGYGLHEDGRARTNTGGLPDPVADLSRACFGGMLPEPLDEEYRGMELEDAMIFMVNDVDRESFKLVLPVPKRRNIVSSELRLQKFRDRWAPVGRHLDRALRIRRALERGEGAVAAELNESGRGDYSDASQRADIEEAFARAQYFRTRVNREDPEETLSAWDQLLEGRFSIIRTTEASGKVRFLAVENDPLDGRIRGLSPLEYAVVQKVVEGESNKAIAIDLDLHAASIANVLRRAMTKLGVSERIQLARLARVMRAHR